MVAIPQTETRLRVPVLLLIFNRPDSTAEAMKSIRAARPPALYIAADGPRAGVATDVARCEEARRVATGVDWACELRTRFSDRNLGCAGNSIGGISWFFENVEEGIMLEDDCVASSSFFRYSQELLEYYRNDPRIMHIAGNSHQYGRRRGKGSYYFSKYANFWGWASWRRAWQQFDPELRPWWELDDDWSAPWQLSIERSGGITIVPNVNMVKNIGAGAGATHTHTIERWAFVEAEEMQFPIVHPREMRVDRAADIFTYYAHHRMVRHHRLVWLYWLGDQFYFRLKPVKRRIVAILRQIVPHESTVDAGSKRS
jgi:hypothetical protein